MTDVWRDRARLSVRRVLAWSPDHQTWDLEDVKGGIAATVPLPEPLWRALLALAASRPVEDRLGGDGLFRPLKVRRLGVPTMIIDHTDWSKRVWHPARAAAGLIGDPALPTLDPRRRALHIKDLRAYAASVVVDSGGTQYEAAALLRHADAIRRIASTPERRTSDPTTPLGHCCASTPISPCPSASTPSGRPGRAHSRPAQAHWTPNAPNPSPRRLTGLRRMRTHLGTGLRKGKERKGKGHSLS